MDNKLELLVFFKTPGIIVQELSIYKDYEYEFISPKQKVSMNTRADFYHASFKNSKGEKVEVAIRRNWVQDYLMFLTTTFLVLLILTPNTFSYIKCLLYVSAILYWVRFYILDLDRELGTLIAQHFKRYKKNNKPSSK